MAGRLASFLVGYTPQKPTPAGRLDYSRYFGGSPGGAPQRPGGRAGSGFTGSYLVLHNASDSALDLTFQPSGRKDFILPGWRKAFPIAVSDVFMDWIVAYRNSPITYAISRVTPIIYDPAEVEAGMSIEEGPIPNFTTRILAFPPIADAGRPGVTGYNFFRYGVATPAVGATVTLTSISTSGMPANADFLFYLYQMEVTGTDVAAVGRTFFTLDAQLQDAANAPLGTTLPFCDSMLRSPFVGSASDRWTYPVSPMTTRGTFTAVAGHDHIAIRFTNNFSVGGVPGSIAGTILMEIDFTNHTPANTPTSMGLIGSGVPADFVL